MVEKEKRVIYLELLDAANRIVKVMNSQNEHGWVDLGYVDGMPEFTVLQINFVGDWIVDQPDLDAVLKLATDRICHARPQADS